MSKHTKGHGECASPPPKCWQKCWRWNRETFLAMLHQAFNAYVEEDSAEGARDVVGALANKLWAWGRSGANRCGPTETTEASELRLTPQEILALPLRARRFILAIGAEMAQTTDDHERLRGALEWYADEASWSVDEVSGPHESEYASCPVLRDEGQKARDALKGGEGES